MGIEDWPEDQRPREKLLARGEAALSDPELLAVVLGTGLRGKSAVDLARDLVSHFGSLTGLLHATPEDFGAFKGLGKAKSTRLLAVRALAKRALTEEMRARDNLSSPAAVRDYLRHHIARRDREVFVVLYLDAQNRVIEVEEMFAGTLTQTTVFPREIARHALRHNAAAVILAHNHPSGLAEPSRADEVLTQALKQTLALLDVKVLDHFVVGSETAMSFAERGLL